MGCLGHDSTQEEQAPSPARGLPLAGGAKIPFRGLDRRDPLVLAGGAAALRRFAEGFGDRLGQSADIEASPIGEMGSRQSRGNPQFAADGGVWLDGVGEEIPPDFGRDGGSEPIFEEKRDLISMVLLFSGKKERRRRKQ